VSYFTLRITIILIETIKDPYQTPSPTRRPIAGPISPELPQIVEAGNQNRHRRPPLGRGGGMHRTQFRRRKKQKSKNIEDLARFTTRRAARRHQPRQLSSLRTWKARAKPLLSA
jgi:hypothetical protein